MITSPERVKVGLYWDRLWRLVSGCTPCSPGCANCWSARYTHRFDMARGGLYTDGLRFNGNIRCNKEFLDLPLRTRKPQSWLILNDLFHPGVPVDHMQTALDVMDRAVQHTFFLLTKRGERMAAILPHLRLKKRAPGLGGFEWMDCPPENVWPMITVCNQEEADRDIPKLLQIRAAVRGVSLEPMWGPINLTGQPWWDWRYTYDFYPPGFARRPIDWLILGAESGPGARSLKIDWALDVVRQGKEAGIPVFVKQLHINGKLSKNPQEWPEDLRVREFPEVGR